MQNKRLVVIGVVVGVVVLVVVALPLIVNADSFRPAIQSQLQAALGRQVTIGHLGLSLLSGGVAADNVAIGDDPKFSNSPFLKAESLKVAVRMAPLIFSRSVQVTGITIDRPELNLVHSPSGQWNFSSLGSGGGKQSSSGGGGDLSIGSLKIVNGRVSITRGGAKPSVYEDVNLTARDISYQTAMPFSLDAKTPGGGKVRLEGTAGPMDRADAALTPLEAKVTVENMDLIASGFMDPSSGIAGVLGYQGTIKSGGGTAHSEGEAKLDKMRLVRGASPAPQPVTFNYASEYDLKRETGVLSRGALRTGSSTINLAGDYDTHGQSPSVRMKLNGSQIPVQDIEALLPALGVTLPAGASLQGGTANANLNLDGPVDRLTTSGTVQIVKTKLAGFDLASKMKVLSALSGLQSSSKDTDIDNLSSELKMSPDGMRFDNMNLVLPALGTLTGSGTIASNNALNFHMVARLAGSAGMLGQMTKGIPILGGAGSGSIPFTIQGTTAQPVFTPDVGGMVGSRVAGQPQQQQQQMQNPLGGLVQGILGGKKK